MRNCVLILSFIPANLSPLLSDVLRIIDGKVPLIVEIKTENKVTEICAATARILSSYGGPYCIQSFSPIAVRWFACHCPRIVRGQLVDDFIHTKYFQSPVKNALLTYMPYNIITKPDFIACNHRFRNKHILLLWKRISGCRLAAWTVTSQEELAAAMKFFDIFIFDSFIPDLPLHDLHRRQT